MAQEKSIFGGTMALVLGAVSASALAVGGYVFWPQLQGEAPVQEQVPPVSEQALSDGVPSPSTANTVDAPAGLAEASKPDLPPEPPSFDLVRIEADGSATVAGRALPASEVEIRIDGEPLERVAVGRGGQFAQLFSIPPAESPRVLSLAMFPASGEPVLSEDQVILAPVSVPVADQEEALPEMSHQGDAPVVAEVEEVEESAAPPDAAPLDGAQGVALSTSAPAPALGPDAASQPSVPPPAQASGLAPAAQESAPAVVLAGRDGVRVLQAPAAADTIKNVALDVISYSEGGEVQLAGRARVPGFVRIYLNNDAIHDANVREDGNWQVELPGVKSGVYTLRVDELNPEGKVRSRIETPFRREAREVVRASQEAGAGQSTTNLITVQPGSTLWAIAASKYGEGTQYVRVFNANKDRIRDPDLIYPGQIFTLPDETNR